MVEQCHLVALGFLHLNFPNIYILVFMYVCILYMYAYMYIYSYIYIILVPATLPGYYFVTYASSDALRL